MDAVAHPSFRNGGAMALRVSCTSLFGENDYYRYVRLRDAVRMRRSGIGLAALGALFTAAGIAIMLDGASTTAFACILAGVLLAGSGCYVIVTGTTIGGSALHGGEARAFLLRHGAVGDPLAFQQTIQLDSDGVTLSSGAPGAHPQQVAVERYPWIDWKRVALEDGVLFIERDTHEGGISNLFGFNYLLRMAERDRFDDAYIPLGSIDGATPEELAAFAREMIAQAPREKSGKA